MGVDNDPSEGLFSDTLGKEIIAFGNFVLQTSYKSIPRSKLHRFACLEDMPGSPLGFN
jgi:hypothetical protein